MSTYTKAANEFADQYFTALAEGQSQFLKTVKTFASFAPAMPSPVPADLPTPREVVDANFAFAAKLLKQQKDFSDKLFTTTSV